MSRDLINQLINAGENFEIFFHFQLQNGKNLCLTSNRNKKIIQNVCYMPYSGLELESALFNDSAHNKVIIKGVFEEGGIEKNMNLDGVVVKIFFHFSKKSLFLEWLVLTYEEIRYDGISFILILNSETMKLHKSMLQNFSLSCRAKFGGNECKVDLLAYSLVCDVVFVERARVTISGCTRPDGFFDGGSIIFDDGASFGIKSHIRNELYLARNCVAIYPSRATLVPSCDKNFITCCNRYNNAVNFRGEPRLPQGRPAA